MPFPSVVVSPSIGVGSDAGVGGVYERVTVFILLICEKPGI